MKIEDENRIVQGLEVGVKTLIELANRNENPEISYRLGISTGAIQLAIEAFKQHWKDRRQEFLKELYLLRNIELKNVCPDCSGTGTKSYPDNATWHHEDAWLAGQAFTLDVCDVCWGSGNKDRPWPSHRRMEALEKEIKIGEIEWGLRSNDAG